MFNMQGYKIHYNNSQINQNDGVIIYIDDSIPETTDIVQINNLKFLNTKIILQNNTEILLSSIYRCHAISKTEFIVIIKNF